MADLFGDDLSGVFDEESPASSIAEEPGTSSSSAGRGKRNLKAPATTAGPVSLKRESGCLDVPEECMLRKKLKIVQSAVDEINLADIMPWIRMQEVDAVEGCKHEEFPFRLHGFQRAAIQCIDNNQSVFVQGRSYRKSVCAEYTIALALRKVLFQDSHEKQLLLPPGQETHHFKIFNRYAIALALGKHQRVVFTCPTKSLSDQKYNRIYKRFHDVGLMAEDVTINPNASCLVMTSKVLRKMLYRRSDVMSEVAWVIFDDIHCMGNSEGGEVWEETIIVLSNTVRYVFLSAVLNNARRYAQWICLLHKQPCHVIYADYRPTLTYNIACSQEEAIG